MKTTKQTERQAARAVGKYRAYRKCEICGSKLATDDIFSDGRCNSTGKGLVLCEADADRVASLSDAEYLAVF